jgi:hypothetical protein
MRESLIGEKQIVSKSSVNLVLRNGQRGQNPQTTGEKEGFTAEMAAAMSYCGSPKTDCLVCGRETADSRERLHRIFDGH